MLAKKCYYFDIYFFGKGGTICGARGRMVWPPPTDAKSGDRVTFPECGMRRLRFFTFLRSSYKMSIPNQKPGRNNESRIAKTSNISFNYAVPQIRSAHTTKLPTSPAASPILGTVPSPNCNILVRAVIFYLTSATLKGLGRWARRVVAATIYPIGAQVTTSCGTETCVQPPPPTAKHIFTKKNTYL